MEQLKLTNLNFTNKWNECQSPYNLPLEVFCLCGFSFLVKGIEKESNKTRLTEEKRFYVMTHRPMSHNTLKVFALDALRRFWRIKKNRCWRRSNGRARDRGVKILNGFFFPKKIIRLLIWWKGGRAGGFQKGSLLSSLTYFAKYCI